MKEDKMNLIRTGSPDIMQHIPGYFFRQIKF